MAFASTRSSADSRFILGGLLLTLALAGLGSGSACAAAQPSVSADYAANVPAPGEAPSEERAAALWKNFADAEALDYRVDLLARFPGFPERLLLRGYQQNPRCSLSSLLPLLAKDCRLSLPWIKCPNRSLWI